MILAAEDGAVDLATLTMTASRNMSPAGVNAVSAGQSSVVAADVAVEPVAAVLPPRSATTASPGSVPDSPGVSYHPGITLDSQWSSAQNDRAAAAAAAAATAAVYNNSYFGAHQAAPVFSQRPQRPLHDIVSSMQGSFHFLQESQIELESTYFADAVGGFVFYTF